MSSIVDHTRSEIADISPVPSAVVSTATGGVFSLTAFRGAVQVSGTICFSFHPKDSR